jgi:hypothetical protein
MERDHCLQHLLLTRFAVKWTGAGFSGEFPPGWLESRFALFEHYCLPSILQQTTSNFLWLLLVHDGFEQVHADRLAGYSERIRVVRDPFRIQDWLQPAVDCLITTRLDSDDALHQGALLHVQRYARAFVLSQQSVWLHNFLNGVQLQAGTRAAYACTKPDSAFLSLFERVHPDKVPITALGGNHSKMATEFPSYQDTAFRGWCMVIHGGNVRNRLRRGAPVLPEEELLPFNLLEPRELPASDA